MTSPESPQKLSLIVYDLETGGLRYDHPIIQFAGITLDDGVPVDKLEVKIKFDVNECDSRALAINCYDEAVWEREAVDRTTARGRIYEYLKGYSNVRKKNKRGTGEHYVARIGGWNITGFDNRRLLKFFQDQFVPIDLSGPVDMRYVAVWEMLRRGKYMPTYTLQNVYEELIGNDKDFHDAMADCEAVVDIINYFYEK